MTAWIGRDNPGISYIITEKLDPQGESYAARYERSQEVNCVLHNREMGVGRTTLTHLLRGFLDSKPIYCAVSLSRLSQHLILLLFYNSITACINEHSESFVIMPSLQTIIKCATGLFAAVSFVRFPRA